MQDPINPKLLGSIEELKPAQYVDVYVNYAYVAHDKGLAIVDVSDPANMKILMSIVETPDEAEAVQVSGRYTILRTSLKYQYPRVAHRSVATIRAFWVTRWVRLIMQMGYRLRLTLPVKTSCGQPGHGTSWTTMLQSV